MQGKAVTVTSTVLQEAASKYKDALSKEQAEREELNRQLEQERTNKQRILAEFQSGNGPSPPRLTNGAPTSNGEPPASWAQGPALPLTQVFRLIDAPSSAFNRTSGVLPH